MNISVVYVYPTFRDDIYAGYALRFVESYQKLKPKQDHETIVVLNGGKQTSELSCMFSGFPHLRFIEHDNSGHDIGAFQVASASCTSDLIMFLGVSTYFKSSLWLHRACEAFERHGQALYGTMGNRGNQRVRVHPHIRTTGFWTSPSIFNSYPNRITSAAQRYPFEHGPGCLTAWATKRGLKAIVVTLHHELEMAAWDSDPNGYHQGNQSSLLIGDRMTEPPFYLIP